MKRFAFLAVLAAAVISGCGKSNTDNTSASNGATPPPAASKKVKLAFITNNTAPFWTICRKGCEQAVKEQPNIDLDFRLDADATANTQKQLIQDLLTKSTMGIAISPETPAAQTETLNAVADQPGHVLVTSDSDAPDSKRAFYIGTDNEKAGEQAGQEILKALPNGGKIMLFVGNVGSQNAIDRIGGIKSVLKDKVTILDVRTDDAIAQTAKANAQDTITKYPDISMLVGIYSYDGPAIVSAVTEAGKKGQIKVICFDEEDVTLQGIKDGVVTSTIVQNPYEFGHQSMLDMYQYLTSADHSFIPADKRIIVPTRVIGKDNVDEFWADLKLKRA
jgi:ribose transport system substrate-binding protein